jgi:hypothetical protein
LARATEKAVRADCPGLISGGARVAEWQTHRT